MKNNKDGGWIETKEHIGNIWFLFLPSLNLAISLILCCFNFTRPAGKAMLFLFVIGMLYCIVCFLISKIFNTSLYDSRCDIY